MICLIIALLSIAGLHTCRHDFMQIDFNHRHKKKLSKIQNELIKMKIDTGKFESETISIEKISLPQLLIVNEE